MVSFSQFFPTQTLYTTLLPLTRATCPAHLILLDFISRTILGEEYRSLSSSLCTTTTTTTSSTNNNNNIMFAKHPTGTTWELSPAKKAKFSGLKAVVVGSSKIFCTHLLNYTSLRPRKPQYSFTSCFYAVNQYGVSLHVVSTAVSCDSPKNGGDVRENGGDVRENGGDVGRAAKFFIVLGICTAQRMSCW